ncbi:hypothetical protein [Caballeronia mineralivorans]|nr:hypothetical protein [Caballeronia mineralivorans]
MSSNCQRLLRALWLRAALDLAGVRRGSCAIILWEIGYGHGRRVDLRKSKLGDGAQSGVLDMHRLLACFLAASVVAASVELSNTRYAAARKRAREKKPASTKRA